MQCPFCGKIDSSVLESREVNEGLAIRRRRECSKCGKRFTTFEEVKGSALWIIKKDGRREPWDAALPPKRRFLAFPKTQRLRPNFSWEDTHSREEMAAPRETSPARTTPAMTQKSSRPAG